MTQPKIFALAHASKEAATYHADIHLRPAAIIVNKMISDALHFHLGKDIPTKVTEKGEKEYWIRGAKIMPPSGQISVWSKWAAKNGPNAWWLVDFAFQLNVETRYRFDCDPTPQYMILQEWLVKGILSPLPKGHNRDDFPLVLPPEFVVCLGDFTKLSNVDMYRAYYANQKGKFRMKWTKREKPLFIDDIPF
jgi:hypothetical protein